MALADDKKYDDELLARIKNGDRGAEQALARKYHPIMLLTIDRQVPDRARCDDLCQESLIAVLQAARDGRIEKSLASYAFIVCRNLISAHRKNKFEMVAIDENAILHNRPAEESEVPDEECRKKLIKAWQALSLQDQRILYLLYVSNLTSEEVGWQFGMTDSTVRQRAHRAKTRIRKACKKKRYQPVTIVMLFILY